MYQLLFLLFFLVSCNPFQKAGKLHFQDMTQEALEQTKTTKRNIYQLDDKYLEEKWLAWNQIVLDATFSFEEIRPIIERKCFDCHDSKTRLPFYARALPRLNPLQKHQDDGLLALDFAEGFPLKSKGTDNQIALLTSIRNAVIDRSMPLKSYTAVYRKRKINDEDQEKILSWVDPLIEKIKDFEDRYKENQRSEAETILEQKCFRCHANGVAKGGFGDMQDTKKLFESKNINRVYNISAKGQMPPNKNEALTREELLILKDWIESR